MQEKNHLLEGDSTYFKNRNCKYYPCHKGIRDEDFSCMFCYCPLYALGEKCGGNYRYLENGIKDCSSCTVPHQKQNYAFMVRKAGELVGKVQDEHNAQIKKE